jgi:DNA-directed RNA polymerase specialized sigma24 family protein
MGLWLTPHVDQGSKSVQPLEKKKDWALTPPAFQELLEWLDEGVSSDGRQYLEMRSRLVAYFDRKNCLGPEDLADETLNRVARRLEEEGRIETETPAKYCYTVARFVFMEYLRQTDREQGLRVDLRQVPSNHPDTSDVEDRRQIREQLLDCLDRCTGQLEPRNRQIILRYYVGREGAKIQNRRALAGELGISMNALSIRACRIRDSLEGCIKRCRAQ